MENIERTYFFGSKVEFVGTEKKINEVYKAFVDLQQYVYPEFIFGDDVAEQFLGTKIPKSWELVSVRVVSTPRCLKNGEYAFSIECDEDCFSHSGFCNILDLAKAIAEKGDIKINRIKI